MSEIVGVRFQQAGKVYYFDSADIPLEVNDYVVVNTKYGLELAKIVISPQQILVSEITDQLKSIVRKAQDEDMKQAERRKDMEKEALTKFREVVSKLGIPMRPLLARYTLDGKYVVLSFSAEERVDFREIVRELSHRLRVRVELRQVGARDGAKIIGGLGKCGFPLCCSTFLTEFTPVSIKIAKEQDLTLSPVKISGVCGKLLCCLGYECDQYRAMKEKLPKVGQEVITPAGKGEVVGGFPLKEAVLVRMENAVAVEVPFDQVSWPRVPKKKRSRNKRRRKS